MWCRTKEDVKTSIRRNSMAHGNRGIGKTSGLLEVIHEDYQGKVILLLPNGRLGSIVKSRYRELFPDDRPPRVVSSPDSLRNAVRGTDLPVFVDTFDLFSDAEKERVHEILRGRVIGCW